MEYDSSIKKGSDKTIYRKLEIARWLSDQESTCQCWTCSFDPWVAKIPWRQEWQPTLVILPGRSPGQRSLADYNP